MYRFSGKRNDREEKGMDAYEFGGALLELPLALAGLGGFNFQHRKKNNLCSSHTTLSHVLGF